MSFSCDLAVALQLMLDLSLVLPFIQGSLSPPSMHALHRMIAMIYERITLYLFLSPPFCCSTSSVRIEISLFLLFLSVIYILLFIHQTV